MKLKKLIIVGSGGFGREVAILAKTCIGYGKDFEIKGFLDDRNGVLACYSGYPPIISDVESYHICPDDVFICAMADGDQKKYYAGIINQKGGQFFSLIHTSAVLAHNVTLGQGCIVSRDVIISNDTLVGDHTSFNSKAMIGHDVKIGKFCHFNAGAFVGGNTNIGQNVTIHTYGIVPPNIVIEDHCVIGANTVVIKNVKKGQTVFGNPGKVIFVK